MFNGSLNVFIGGPLSNTYISNFIVSLQTMLA